MSPSASSLDSGYCGPASVQSSIDSPHNHLGYPSSPWTPQHHHHVPQHHPPQSYYNMSHPAENSYYHSAPTPEPSGGSKNYHDSDISQIVDQVLSCIDQFSQENETHEVGPSHNHGLNLPTIHSGPKVSQFIIKNLKKGKKLLSKTFPQFLIFAKTRKVGKVPLAKKLLCDSIFFYFFRSSVQCPLLHVKIQHKSFQTD